MGSGRGKQRRVAATIAPGVGVEKSPKLVSAGDPVNFMRGHKAQLCLWSSQHDVDYYISESHSNPETLLSRFTENLARCPKRLRKPLKFVGFPHDTKDGIEPGAPGTCPISAAQDQGLILVWGTQHAETDYRNLSQQNIEHELAHLSADESGVPKGMLQLWQNAQDADATHHLTMPETTPFREDVWLGDVIRKLNRGQSPLTSYAVDNINEDWAESVEYYLIDQRQGYLWRGGGEEMRFEDYYPNRARLISEFLSS